MAAVRPDAGAARAIRPYHTTTADGDQLFAVSTRKLDRDDVNTTIAGTLTVEVVADVVPRGVMMATAVDGWPAARDIRRL
ncbi:MAG: hypothetical protein ACRD2X_24385 [Vicinamibacteraceae bacterium]